ncbi:pseudouridine synthase [Hymenobacter sp. NST-14]|uniref:pseudouridine synthase n=1 Tax=Hymenobacter piscis TaxID=2839984 RepID=UPI001C015751|nr:pseudouridine synthase [Hymenobacter piscis]MBT9392241.1 pseudouridine synthase [Hymenobacter piscis]
MGKKHSSGDASGRKGRSTDSGRSAGPGAEGFRKFIQPGAERASRPGGNARFGNDRDNRSDRDDSRRDDSRRGNDRPSFGRPADGSTGGPRKFGNGGNSFGGPRKFGNSGGDFRREGRDERSARDFRRDNREERPARDERPVRDFEPKKTWQGQPYRREDGQSAVPRGLPGERNRKFVKQNPNAADEPRQEAPRPRPQEDFQGSKEYGADRPIRPARSFDFRGRPEDLADQRPPRSEDRDERPVQSARRDDDFGRDRRDSGDRKPQGFGAGASGERRTARPGSFGSERTERPARDDRREPRAFDRDERRGSSSSFDKKRPFSTERRDNRAGDERPRRAYDQDRRSDAPASNQAGKPRRGEVAGQAPDYANLRHYEEDKTRGNKRRREEDDADGNEVRLNRYIANAGICSRRDADALIAAGEIKVNGEVVTEMGYKVQPTDTVQYGKTNLNREKQVYLLLNKPKDFLTTTDDPEGRRTVMELIKSASKERVFPVGRLDRNTTGLLLFTNDGEVAQKLSHPSHRNKKIYQVELDKPLTEEHLRQIAAGVTLEDGKAEVDDVAVVAGNPHFVGVEIHIGRNRIVRRIFEHLGYDVVTLDRVQYAGLTKKDLPRGKWRFLTEKEVIRLKYFM